jgi:hypothetical protein
MKTKKLVKNFQYALFITFFSSLLFKIVLAYKKVSEFA